MHIPAGIPDIPDNMVLSQTVMLAQVVPNMWGVWQGIIEGLSLLGPPIYLASWPASLIKRVDGEPTKRAAPALLVTPVKSGCGKSSSRSAGEGVFSTPVGVPQICRRFSKFAYVDVYVGKCLLTSCERIIQKETLNPFVFDTIWLDALLQ